MKLVSYSSIITIMHGPIYIRVTRSIRYEKHKCQSLQCPYFFISTSWHEAIRYSQNKVSLFDSWPHLFLSREQIRFDASVCSYCNFILLKTVYSTILKPGMSMLHFAAFLINNRSNLALHTEHLDIILVVRTLEIYDNSTENSCRPSSKSTQSSHPLVIPHINRLYHKSYKQHRWSKQCTAISAEPSVCHFLLEG